MATEKKTSEDNKSEKKYFTGIGRRKTAIAQVRIQPGKGKFIINEKETSQVEDELTNPLILTGQLGKFDVSVIVKSGGFNSQKDAIILGISRALINFDDTLKPTLRKAGLVTRDPREKERKKPGLKRARKAPQWQKR